MNKICKTYTITAEQTENFFNKLIEIIKIILYCIPIALIIALIIFIGIKIYFAKQDKKKEKETKIKNKFINSIKLKQQRNISETKKEFIKEEKKYTIKKVKENSFFNEQLNKCTNCEKEYYKILYKLFNENYQIETQVYLRSMFPKMKAPNHKIDIVFKTKNYEKPILLIEINDETHNKRTLTKLRDKELKEFCNEHNIKLQAIWTKFDINEKSIYNLIKKRLSE